MHPLLTNLKELKDAELEVKIQDLSKKYFMTANAQVQEQIVMLLDSFKEELMNRRRTEWDRASGLSEKGLDKLINIS